MQKKKKNNIAKNPPFCLENLFTRFLFNLISDSVFIQSLMAKYINFPDGVITNCEKRTFTVNRLVSKYNFYAYFYTHTYKCTHTLQIIRMLIRL